jgi:hypothetical protein
MERWLHQVNVGGNPITLILFFLLAFTSSPYVYCYDHNPIMTVLKRSDVAPQPQASIGRPSAKVDKQDSMAT